MQTSGKKSQKFVAADSIAIELILNFHWRKKCFSAKKMFSRICENFSDNGNIIARAKINDARRILIDGQTNETTRKDDNISAK